MVEGQSGLTGISVWTSTTPPFGRPCSSTKGRFVARSVFVCSLLTVRQMMPSPRQCFSHFGGGESKARYSLDRPRAVLSGIAADSLDHTSAARAGGVDQKQHVGQAVTCGHDQSFLLAERAGAEEQPFTGRHSTYPAHAVCRWRPFSRRQAAHGVCRIHLGV